MIAGAAVLAASWIAWAYPFIFLAPHNQKRPNITVAGPTRAGLLLECTWPIFMAFSCRMQAESAVLPWWRLAGTVVFGPVAGVAGSWAIRAAPGGRQFRVNAGLYEDHELVTTGPYALVRHPIYSSLLAILLSTMSLLTRPAWMLAALTLFIAGTEIRVATEDGLLASRFGEKFADYRRRVKAYVPLVR